MKIFIKLLGWFFYIGELFKGNKIVTIVIEPPEANEPIVVQFGDATLTFYCSERQYRRKYDKWFIPTDNHISYTVYCVPSDNASEALKLICATKLDLPALLPKSVDIKFQKVAIIHAYIDIIMNKLIRIKAGLPP